MIFFSVSSTLTQLTEISTLVVLTSNGQTVVFVAKIQICPIFSCAHSFIAYNYMTFDCVIFPSGVFSLALGKEQDNG